MIRRTVYVVGLTGLLAWGCGSSGTTGGSGATDGSGGSGATGGTGGSGGSSATGGTAGAGGSAGSGGTAASGGSGGVGGKSGSGGAAGSAGTAGPDGGGLDAGGQAGTGATDSGTGGAGGSDSGVPGNTIGGGVNGGMFNTIMSALYAGMPDNPASLVIFLFEAPVQCSQITAVGWDTRIMNRSQILELLMMGMTPMVYPVTTSTTAAPGEALIHHSVAATTGTPVETQSNAGTVTLTTLNVGVSAVGSFDLTFPNGSLKGTFNATYCPGGVEP